MFGTVPVRDMAPSFMFTKYVLLCRNILFSNKIIFQTDAMMNVLDPTSVERPRTPPPPYPPPPTYEEAIANSAV